MGDSEQRQKAEEFAREAFASQRFGEEEAFDVMLRRAALSGYSRQELTEVILRKARSLGPMTTRTEWKVRDMCTHWSHERLLDVATQPQWQLKFVYRTALRRLRWWKFMREHAPEIVVLLGLTALAWIVQRVLAPG